MLSGRSGLAPAHTALAALVLLASVAGLRFPLYTLREGEPNNCGFAHFGGTTGSAQRLVETHLSPGVADWNIVVPMPPPCAEAQVTGVRMRVCDGDSAPDVSLTDTQSARVHRTGALAGVAAVNVTVYCILPPTTPPPTLPPPSTLTDSRSTYEILSKELSSSEVTSNEESSNESESMELPSAELTTTVKPTTSTTTKSTTTKSTTIKSTTTKRTTTTSTTTTSPPPPPETTAKVTTPAEEVVTPSPYKTDHSKEKSPKSVKVTINITPGKHVSPKEDVSQSYDAEMLSIPNKEKRDGVMSSQNTKFSSVPFVETPPRFSEHEGHVGPPRQRFKRPRDPPAPLFARPRRPHRYRPATPPRYLHAPHYAPHYAPYEPSAPYSLASRFAPLGLLGQRLTRLQRPQPLVIFRHF